MRWSLAVCALVFCASAAAGACSRFPLASSTTHKNGIPVLTWRTDFPSTLPPLHAPWAPIKLDADWQGYIGAILNEVKTSGVTIQGGRIVMPAQAPWWIAPWMDFGRKGREPLAGLTRERSPDPGDLSPSSAGNYQVWAIGWYNARGAYALGQVFADPCNPSVPVGQNGVPFTFPDGSATFKLLFTTANAPAVAYLEGAPTIKAMIGGANATEVRLLQVDVAVRDTQATKTGWVFGTYVWKKDSTPGDGLFDNLVPVGLMWGNDPGAQNTVFSGNADLASTRLNPDLAGHVWQSSSTPWPQRPYPGFQGRLNGPADNWRSSCVACHAAAQFPRSPNFGSPPGSWSQTTPPATAEVAAKLATYFKDVPGSTLADPSVQGAVPLDYSLQLQEAFIRMCDACKAGALTGRTPALCISSKVVTTANCPKPNSPTALMHKKALAKDLAPARQ
jgi:hypothetical protein